MDTFEAIAARRSVKKFDPDHVMSEEEITRLMEAVVLSPTSYNIQNWRFVLITDPETKREMRARGYGQEQFSNCSVIVMICGDREAYNQDPCNSTNPTTSSKNSAGMVRSPSRPCGSSLITAIA